MTDQGVSIIQVVFRSLVLALRGLREFGNTQFLTGVMWCVFCGWLNSLSQIYVDKMHWAHFKEGETKPLPDIGFILLPRVRIARLPDIWNAVIVIGTLLPVILFHPSKVKIMRRYAAVQGTCFLLRSLTIMATILPNPYDTCVNSSKDDEIPMIEAFKVMLGVRITCGDVLYSGHAANFTLMGLIWQQYGRGFVSSESFFNKRASFTADMDVSINQDVSQIQKYTSEWYTGVLLPRLCWVVASIGYLIIIACRFHYTVDVLVGIVVVAKQWGLYHMIIRTPKLIERVPFLQWYESKGIFAPHAYMREATIDYPSDGQSDTPELHFSPTPARISSPNRDQVQMYEYALEEGGKLINTS
jgi:hypothetical protein